MVYLGSLLRIFCWALGICRVSAPLFGKGFCILQVLQAIVLDFQGLHFHGLYLILQVYSIPLMFRMSRFFCVILTGFGEEMLGFTIVRATIEVNTLAILQFGCHPLSRRRLPNFFIILQFVCRIVRFVDHLNLTSGTIDCDLWAQVGIAHSEEGSFA